MTYKNQILNFKGRACLALALALLFVMNACSDGTIFTSTEPDQQVISKVDGQPIVNLDVLEFYESDYFDQARNNLAAHHGAAIVSALNDQISVADLQSSPMIAVKDLGQYTRKKGTVPEIGSTHIHLIREDGETEDFVLTLRPYYSSPQMIAKAVGGTNALNTETTWLALSPDRFHLQEDENGEIWPVTFPAVSLNDPDREITLTFNKQGFVSSSLTETSSGNSINSNSQPNIVFVEATPALINPCVNTGPNTNCEQFDPPGGGGGGGGDDGDGPYCTEVSGRGGPVGGPTEGSQTYFMLDGIELWATGDGDGAAELQMFVTNDDDYDGECFPRSYKYRFDDKFYYDPLNKLQLGADERGGHLLPDVNHEGVFYGFNLDYRGWYGPPERGFSLINLTHNPGPWRLVLSDDDDDYQDFSQRRQSDYADDIWTYDMSDGTWSEVYTGFSTDRHTYGKSDDPIRESGVRRITHSNVLDRLDGVISLYNSFVASKNYPGGRFAYEFSLLEY